MQHRWKIGASLIGAVLIAAPQARSQIADLRIGPEQSVPGAGAVQATDGTQLVRGTLGQGIVGNVRAGNTDAAQGFWHPLPRTTGETPVAGAEPATLQATPNPFHGSTRVALTNPRSQHVSLILYDLLGQPVRAIIDDVHPAGPLAADITAHDLPSGSYTLILQAGDVRQTLPLTLLK